MRKSAIRRFVEHHQGPTAVAGLLGAEVPQQRVSEWVKRGWASPMHLFRLEPHLPPGMSLRDLADDRKRAKRRERLTS